MDHSFLQSNGKAESAVKEAKKILLKCKKTSSDEFLALLDHRNTLLPPSATPVITPEPRRSQRVGRVPKQL